MALTTPVKIIQNYHCDRMVWFLNNRREKRKEGFVSDKRITELLYFGLILRKLSLIRQVKALVI